MKTIIHPVFLAVALFFISCSNDDEILYPETPNTNVPVEPLPTTVPIEIPGSPKMMKKYQHGSLHYWVQYYYRPDGKILKVDYSHPEYSSEIFTNNYYYNSDGKLLKIDGHDDYTFDWDKDRIIGADRYNGMWTINSRILYEYDAQGQLTQKTEYNQDFSYSEKTIYSYFDDKNLKAMEQYGDYEEVGDYKLYFVTNFNAYNEDKNLFLELEIIPGQIVQQQFPTSMNFKHFTETGYDFTETYNYKYDAQGRVVEKISGYNKVVYEYY